MCVAGCCPSQECGGINVAGLLGWALRTVMLERFFLCLACIAFVLIFIITAKEEIAGKKMM